MVEAQFVGAGSAAGAMTKDAIFGRRRRPFETKGRPLRRGVFAGEAEDCRPRPMRRPSQERCRLWENSRFARRRARSEPIFAIGCLLIAQNGPKLRENWIARLGIQVYTQSA